MFLYIDRYSKCAMAIVSLIKTPWKVILLTEHFEISFSSIFNRTDVLGTKVFFFEKNLTFRNQNKIHKYLG